MFKVLVVDDEPIILSGVSHLLDWQSLDCTITGCCRNGQEALSAIKASPVDIVITDIKMPVMDGLELIRECNRIHPEIVFIILTSLEEFRLVKEALRYSVSEYMVKTELDAAALRAVMERVKEEVLHRRSLYAPQQDRSDGDLPLERIISNLMLMRTLEPSAMLRLESRGLLDSFGMLNFFIHYPSSSLETSWSIEDYSRLFEWQKDVVEKILPSVFPSVTSVNPPTSRCCSLIYFVHNVDPSIWKASVSRLAERVRKASLMLVNQAPVLASSGTYSGRDGLAECRGEIERAGISVYLGKEDFTLEPLDLDGVYVRIEEAIKQKSASAFETVLSYVLNVLSTKDHMLSQASFTLSAIQSAIRAGLAALGILDAKALDEYFAILPFISTRDRMVQLVAEVREGIGGQLRALSGEASSPMIDRAREYIIAHIEERISLSDVASCAGVSPGYLSKSFKRVMGRSLVDYVNGLKIEKAKEMMARGSSIRISEIAQALGYDNIYYFSKVFKRVTGESPTAYMKEAGVDGAQSS